ncbi:DUF1289 domain-containing protein [Halopseudomonas maritima]|uniref:DUF1289 domain-containing protein n=1 Tax=Halopseudomonas maritima TaxID=2918528 RepID=UPI001EE9DA60|nr:DUF1289 domain-containing protein [Halopseudomonas maritima]UJJ30155.1 DUF1289 domain-containing protein [Halopseudomonas maritima]
MTTRGRQPSPCVRKCCLDGELCMGCGRLLDEILEWGRAPDARQREIIAAAARRRAERQSR